MKSRIPLILSAAAVVAMCIFIFSMSAQTDEESAEVSMGVVWHIIGFVVPGYDQMSVADQLYWQGALDHPVRKTAHFLEYLVLGGLMMNLVVQVKRASGCSVSTPLITPKLAALAWLLATLYAASDEIHQLFVPGRAFMVTDVLLDSAGVLVGVAIVSLILKRVFRKAA